MPGPSADPDEPVDDDAAAESLLLFAAPSTWGEATLAALAGEAGAGAAAAAWAAGCAAAGAAATTGAGVAAACPRYSVETGSPSWLT